MVFSFTPKQILSVSHIAVNSLGIFFMAIAAALDWATVDYGIPVGVGFNLKFCVTSSTTVTCVDDGARNVAVYSISLVLVFLALMYTVYLRHKNLKGSTCGYVSLHLLGLVGCAGAIGWWRVIFFLIDVVGNSDAVTYGSGLWLAIAGLMFSFVSMFMKCICGKQDFDGANEGTKQVHLDSSV